MCKIIVDFLPLFVKKLQFLVYILRKIWYTNRVKRGIFETLIDAFYTIRSVPI